MELKPFDFDPALAAAFLRFGFEHYAGDRGWIPPNKAMLSAQLAPGFGFYRKAGNHHRHFLCTSGSKLLGRVSAFVNADLRDRDGTGVGAVGLFECVEDEAVGRELLDAACSAYFVDDEAGAIAPPKRKAAVRPQMDIH